MGRQKSEHPKGKLVIRSKQIKKSGLVPIYISYFVKGKTIDKTTSIDILPEQWNADKQKVVKHKEAPYLNAKLDSMRNKLDSAVASYEGILTPEKLRRILDGDVIDGMKDPKKISFVDYCLENLTVRYGNGEIGYSTKYNGELYIRKFAEFLTRRNGDQFLTLAELDSTVIDAYKAERLKSIGRSTLNKEIAPIAKAIITANQVGLIDGRKFGDMSCIHVPDRQRQYTGKIEGNDTVADINYLTHEQMKAFVDYYPKAIKNRTRDIMDMFLFSFHACGLRISDIATLEWSHIDFEKRQLTKVLVKGKNFHEIYLTDSAMEILNRWKAKQLNERFVFDLLPSNFKFAEKADEAREKELKFTIASKNRTIQTSLNNIGEQIGITNFRLTMHVARHTFAVWALNDRDISIDIISRLLGHQSIAATEKNYARFLKDKIDDVIQEKVTFLGYDPII